MINPSGGYGTPPIVNGPRLKLEGDVLERDTAIDDGDDDLFRGATIDVPCPLHVDRGEVPLLRKERVVGHEQRVAEIGRLGVVDVRSAP